MGAVIVIMGGISGFVVALTGWLIFDLGPFAALAIWAGAGPFSALIVALPALIGPPGRPPKGPGASAFTNHARTAPA